MNVLYIGNCFDGTGWGDASVSQATALGRALLSSGAGRLVYRPIRQGSGPPRTEGLSDEFLSLIDEKGPAGPYDAVICHVLPNQMVRDASAGRRFICYFACETSDFKTSGWAEHLNLTCDEVWVINRASREAALRSGVRAPVRVVPHVIEEPETATSPPDYRPLPCPDRTKGHFVFYSVGEFVKRKNVTGLVRAFDLEFSPEEPVELVLKTSVPGEGDPGRAKGMIQEAIKNSRAGTRLKRFKEIHVVTQRLDRGQLAALHERCDCFVSASYGEAWQIPAAEAMAMGKTPIVPASTGFLDWAVPCCCHRVRTAEAECFGAVDALEGVYSSRENWRQPQTAWLRRAMRDAYQRKVSPFCLDEKEKKRRGLDRAKLFAHDKVGPYMKDLLLLPREKGEHGPQVASRVRLCQQAWWGPEGGPGDGGGGC